MMLDVFTHLFNTDVLGPLLQSRRAFFMPFYLGHPLLPPFLTLYGTPAKCCLCIRLSRGPHCSRAWLVVNINNI
jgi:hypothetical protein